MAITVKHSKVSTIPDEADTSLVRPSDWNADHTLTGTIDIANGGTGQTTANAAFNALVPSQTGNTGKYLTTDGTDTSWATNPLGTVTSVNLTASTGISVSGGPITTSGSITVTNTAPDQTVVLNSGTGISTSGTYPNFTVTNTAPDQTVSIASGTGISTSGTYPAFTVTNTGVTSAVAGTGISVSSGTGAVTVTNTAPDQTVAIASGTGISVSGTYPNFTVTNTSPSSGGTVTSVGLTSSASSLAITNTPITSSGNIGINYAGIASQYVRGDGSLANFPTTTGGGSSVSYYLNGSVNQGTFGGNTYYQMSKTPVFSTGTNFNISADGYIAQFITDANDPSLLAIPAGNWNFEMYFSTSSAGGTPNFYLELYKYNGTTFTLIASGSTNPEGITGGVSTDLYITSLGVPATTLAVTDRLAVRVYVNHSGRTITLHTEDNNLCQVITTFSTGLNALNGLTAQVQYFATGTSGSDFNISSATNTHTFNIPSSSGSNRGLLTSADWTTFNSKVTSVSGTTGRITSSGGTTPAIDLASGIVTAGTTGSSTLIPVITVDTYGRVTSVTTASNPQGTVTSVTGTSPVVSSGGATPAISLASGYGDTLNPYASKTANFVLASPNGSAGVPTFRAIVAADIPTLNQNTTGTASNVTGTVAVANGGTGLTSLTANRIPYGNGTSAYQSSANLTFNGTTLVATDITDSSLTAGRVTYAGTAGNLVDSSSFTFDGTTQSAPVQRASNGIVTNNKTIGTSFTIPSTDNAMSSGPVTLSAGVTVTVSSGSRWVVL